MNDNILNSYYYCLFFQYIQFRDFLLVPHEIDDDWILPGNLHYQAFRSFNQTALNVLLPGRFSTGLQRGGRLENSVEEETNGSRIKDRFMKKWNDSSISKKKLANVKYPKGRYTMSKNWR